MQWVQGIRVKSYVHSICDNSTLGGIYFVYLSISQMIIIHLVDVKLNRYMTVCKSCCDNKFEPWRNL